MSSERISLEILGWTAALEAASASSIETGLEPGRVIASYTQLYRLGTRSGELLAAASGRFRHKASSSSDFPVVGDWVLVRRTPGGHRGVIESLLPRTTAFTRKGAGRAQEHQVLAANIDTLLLMSGLDDDFNIRRIERYLVLALRSGAQPVVLLNKSDLRSDVEEAVAATRAVAPGIPVHPLSAREGVGLEALAPYLTRARTLALLGSSGCGKSTLLNRLLGREHQPTQTVRAHDSRGRHTTTNRELFVLPSGALVIDTPGLRELQLTGDGAEAAADTYDDIETLAAGCRFSDCRHGNEPGCAVHDAIASGRLDPGRLDAYRKIQREIKWQALKADETAARAEKRKWRAIQKAVKRHRPRE